MRAAILVRKLLHHSKRSGAARSLTARSPNLFQHLDVGGVLKAAGSLGLNQILGGGSWHVHARAHSQLTAPGGDASAVARPLYVPGGQAAKRQSPTAGAGPSSYPLTA